jgi:pimeloyl-ACP methyl ester carboxylesterase
MLRAALRVDTLTLDGASYGTYLAERYAIAHPDHVARLVLDSTVPHDGYDFYLNTKARQRIATVLRIACAQTQCATDPVADLAQIIAQRHNGPALMDALTGRTGGVPRLADLPTALHAAAAGQTGAPNAIIAANLRAAGPALTI